jgi:hypothetical protein
MLNRLSHSGALVFSRRSATMRRSAPTGKQGFQKKGKITTKDKADNASNRNKLAKEYEAIGKMARPTIVKPMRSPEEMEQAKRMTLIYQTEKLRQHNTWRKGEQQRIKLRDLAVSELPATLREQALKPDETPFPREFIWTLQNPPLESQEIFGPYMAGEQFRPLDY